MRTIGWLLVFFILLVMALRAYTALASSAAAVVVVPVSAADASSSLVGPPSVSASLIDRVLVAAHSPAAGIGADVYADGVRTGIDPVFALAFFRQETSFGSSTLARLTHSLANIRCSAGYACIDGFRAYPSWAASAADWFSLIVSVYLPRGLSTVPAIVPVYAPASDGNAPTVYIASVEASVSAWRAGQVV